jgi:hypothetical protein
MLRFVPIIELAKIPSIRSQIKEVLGLEVINQPNQVVDDNEDAPIVLQSMNQEGRRNASHQPFFISLLVNDLLLHNCMLDSGASTNVMSLIVMNQLGLKTTRPYRNICAMDSKEVKVCGLIKDLHIRLTIYPDISLLMDVVVIDVPDAWGMLLSHKWVTQSRR